MHYSEETKNRFKKLQTICNEHGLYLHKYNDINDYKMTILDSEFNIYGIVTVVDRFLNPLLSLDLDNMFDMYNLKKLVSTREETISFFKQIFPKDVVCDMMVIDMDFIKNRYKTIYTFDYNTETETLNMLITPTITIDKIEISFNK
jgi:hypothetical protein